MNETVPTPEVPAGWRRTTARAVERAAVWGVSLWAAWSVLKYLYVAIETVDYPYHLEWMEGGFVETVERLLAGKDIYPPPGLEYVGYIYPPFYFVVSGALSLVMGVDFFALRLVSLLAILGVGWLLFRFIQRETGSWRWGVVGVGLFFATYDVGGRWFHIARVDSLYLMLTLAALYLMRFRGTTRSAALGGLLMGLAFLTKQAALMSLLPAGLVLLVVDRQRALVAGVVGAAVVGLVVLYLNAMTDGWFWYYLVDVPKKHVMLEQQIEGFWRNDLWKVGPILGGALMSLGLLVAKRPKTGLFYAALFLGFIVSSWLSRIHNGGWINVVIPAFAAIALVLPMGFSRVEQAFAPGERRRLGASPTAVGLALFLVLQLFMLRWDASWSIPPEDAQAKGDRLLEVIAGMPGDVFIPDWRWLPTWADKTSYGQGMAGSDVRRGTDPKDPGLLRLNAELRQAFRSKRFSHVILTDDHHPLLRLMRPYYKRSHAIAVAPPLVAGAAVRPRVIYVPR